MARQEVRRRTTFIKFAIAPEIIQSHKCLTSKSPALCKREQTTKIKPFALESLHQLTEHSLLIQFIGLALEVGTSNFAIQSRLKTPLDSLCMAFSSKKCLCCAEWCHREISPLLQHTAQLLHSPAYRHNH